MPVKVTADDIYRATLSLFREFDIETHTLRCQVSCRGGGIEIDVSSLFGDGARMTAYQNYLGGGIAGSIQSARNFKPRNKRYAALADRLAERLKRYFYSLNNGGGDDYMQESASYVRTQQFPRSAY